MVTGGLIDAGWRMVISRPSWNPGSLEIRAATWPAAHLIMNDWPPT